MVGPFDPFQLITTTEQPLLLLARDYATRNLAELYGLAPGDAPAAPAGGGAALADE